MTSGEALSVMQSAVMVAAKISAPILIISIFIGLVISIFQAATQIHEQTITFVPKLIAIAIVLLICGSWMMETLADFTKQIFNLML